MCFTKKKSIILYKSIVSWKHFKTYKNTNVALNKLYIELKTQKYQPSKLKKINFFLINKNFQQLYVFNWLDKLVYKAILSALEPFLKKVFLKEVYGFQDKKNLNNALKCIQCSWKNISWIISIDLEKYFNTINFSFILKWLSKYFDQPTVELIWKLFNAGHLCSFKLKDQISYKTENIFLSLILVNLYLTDLDHYVVKVLKTTYTKTERNKTFFMDSISKLFKRLYYVRYISNVVIGFAGNRKEITNIYNQINKKLKELKFDLSSYKITVYESHKKNINFADVCLNFPNYTKILFKYTQFYKDFNLKTLKHQKFKFNVFFKIKLYTLVNKLIKIKFLKKTLNSFRSTAVLKYSVFENGIIIKIFSFLIDNIVNFYSFLDKKLDLWKILYFLRKCCALTLAHKCKLSSAAKVFKKYGNDLKINHKFKITQVIYSKFLKVGKK